MKNARNFYVHMTFKLYFCNSEVKMTVSEDGTFIQWAPDKRVSSIMLDAFIADLNVADAIEKFTQTIKKAPGPGLLKKMHKRYTPAVSG